MLSHRLWPSRFTSTPVSQQHTLFLIHGLFGNKMNWKSIADKLHASLDTDTFPLAIVTLDLPNHGESIHMSSSEKSSPMTLPYLADKVYQLIDSLVLKNTQGNPPQLALLGHSLGGKVAMHLALSGVIQSPLILDLIVADMTPTEKPLPSKLTTYLNAMAIIDKDPHCNSRQEADRLLATIEPDLVIRQFLLTNLSYQKDTVKIRFDVPWMQSSLPQFNQFPLMKAPPEKGPFMGRTLFIAGKQSDYLQEKDIPVIDRLFPKNTIEWLDAGHWVHADQPDAFIQLVTNFLLYKQRNHEHGREHGRDHGVS